MCCSTCEAGQTSKMLEFEKESLLNILNENSLTICSKGIGVDRILANLLQSYSSACHLVVVIGTEVSEEDSVCSQIATDPRAKDDGDFLPPKRITSDSMLATSRRDLYLSGGVIFITTRILVVDMLTKRIPFESITGIVVMNAHRVFNDCHLSFILRLFRMNNQTGFITALSQNASAFLGSFARLERIMRQLFVAKLFLWPRFHATIVDSLSARTVPNVIEMRIQMTSSMKQIQFAITDLISLCIKELTSMNSFIFSNTIELQSTDSEARISTINVIANNFNRLVRANLDSVWYQLSSRARRLIRDIQLLKSLLFHLTELDSVTFFGELKHIRDSVSPDSNPSDWLFWPPTETLFKLAQERVYTGDKSRKYHIEINPKLAMLIELLDEIEEKNRVKSEKATSGDSDPAVVDVIIVVENRYSIIQIEQYRDKGHNVMIDELKHKCEMLLDCKKIFVSKKDNEDDDVEFFENQLTLTQMMGCVEDHEANIIRRHHRLQLHYFEWSADPNASLGLKGLLTTLRPRYVILYEPEMAAIRQIELYQAHQDTKVDPIEVFFFIFDGSAEEQRYLRNLQVEKDSFEKLIQEKSQLAKSNDLSEINAAQHPDLIRGKQSLFHPEEVAKFGNSRIGGGQISAHSAQRQVLVDLREFRSLLPSCIHKIGIDLEPVTLEIGDYVISPESCIERKSISDLIGSLNSGRLYSQAQVMTRYYKRSLLLIEFEDHKSFNFKARYWGETSGAKGPNSRPSPLLQLAILAIQFPLLRFIWSPSPAFSADIIDELKRNKEEPNKEKHVIRISTGKPGEVSQLPVEYVTDRYDIEVKDFLLCLPGVTTLNVYTIMNHCRSLIELAELPLDKLAKLLDSEHHAQLLHRSLHAKAITEQDLEQQQSNRAKRSKLFTCVRRKKKS